MTAPRFAHLSDFPRARIAEPDNVKLRLQRMEKPQAWPVDLMTKIRMFPASAINQYPRYDLFYEKLAGFVGCGVENLIVGHGSDELIRSIFAIYTSPGDGVAFPYPSYAMYEVYCRMFGVEADKMVSYPGSGGSCGMIEENSGIIFIVNPGQPIETFESYFHLYVLASMCDVSDKLLVIDEAYFGFGAETALPLIEEFDNVIILRTFSKVFGAAGLRLGYAIGSEKAIAPLKAFRLAGEASAFSMHTASVLIDHFDSHVQPSIDAICEGRDWLREKVKSELHIDAWGQYGNHVLIDVIYEEWAQTLAANLARQGTYVNAGLPAPVNHHLLVTAGPVPMMEIFFEQLSALYQ